MWKYIIIIVMLAVLLYYLTSEEKTIEEHVKNGDIEEACAVATDELEVFDLYQKKAKTN